ncbi:MAG: 50S ribosomal protein L9 [Gammaproteobacteria bacterium]|nr:MAG: 50S ribosomal protein L9 [Gammaproteobacteria bacterium]
MNIILLERVANLGDLGDEVAVKAGYARNFLIPQGKAARATDENRKVFGARRAELEQAALQLMGAAERRAAQLVDVSVTVVAKSGEEGKLYGSVGTQDIVDALAEQGIEVARTEVRMPEGAIRALGEYEIGIHLHTDVDSIVRVEVLPE